MSQIKKDLIVTGIPRGGTTLTAALIDSLNDTICLSEPNWQGKWFFKEKKARKLVKLITEDFNVVREKILKQESIIDKRNSDGTPVTNYFGSQRKGPKQKNNPKLKRSITFPVKDENFTLGMKHNAHYTSILPELIQTDQFSIIAVMRHPVPTILSWLSLNLPISKGKLPAGEGVWTELREITDSNDQLLTKQVRIYDLFCQRYMELEKHIHLLKYEDIVKSPSILEELTGQIYERELNLDNRNRSKIYDYRMEDSILEEITRHAPHALKLYPL